MTTTVSAVTNTKTFIRSFGLFWRRDEINWSPGAGNGGQFRLLGRMNKNQPALRVADFRDQRGIYILYDDWGARYVGLARRQGLGDRLKDHLVDKHGDDWDRFSWFGFRRVLTGYDAAGLHKLGAFPTSHLSGSDSTIGDIEALLITTLGTRGIGNIQQAHFKNADQWEQIRQSEVDRYLGGA